MSQQELDLLQVSSCLAAELRASAPQIVRAEVLNPDLLGSFGDDRPDGPVAQALSDLASLANGPEERPVLDSTRLLPGIDSLLHPDRNRYRPDSAPFSEKVNDDPAVLPHLDVFHGKRGQLSSPQSTADQEGKDGIVPLALHYGAIGDSEQFPCLLFGEPVSKASTLLLQQVWPACPIMGHHILRSPFVAN